MLPQDETPTFVPNMDQAELLRMAALAAKWKEPARDALDTLVLSCADLHSLEVYQQIEFVPFDPTVKRTEGECLCLHGVGEVRVQCQFVESLRLAACCGGVCTGVCRA